VQNEIADAVRSQISPASAGSSVATERSGTTNPAAYRLYLQGRYCWNKRTASDLERALGYFQQAIALDKEFALAHLGIAETYTLQGQYADRSFAEIKPRATEEAERAIEIDNSLGEAHAVLGQIQEYAWDWADAEREFKLALEKAPAYATAYHWYFIFLGVMGRDDEAFSAIKKAVELDPYSPIIQANLVQAYMGRGDDGDADEVAKKILAIEPQFFFGRVFRAEILARQGHSKEALGYLDGINLAGLSSHNLGSVAYAYASAGETGKARMILRDLCRVNRDSNTDPVAIAMIYAGLGDADSTITWLQNARDKRSILLPNARVWREFRLVHDDPRYVSILRSMGLPLPGE